MNDVKSVLTESFCDAARRAILEIAPDATAAAQPVIENATLERPAKAEHGDYACTLPMLLARVVKKNPRLLAQEIQSRLSALPLISRTEIAGAGFINIYLTVAARGAIVANILEEGNHYGKRDIGKGQPVLIEFVSANPTGPLHVGHGRQAALGDTLANILSAQNFQVSREFYYNDAGNQIQNLALSVQARAKALSGETIVFPESGYHGEYIIEIAKRYREERAGSLSDLDAIRLFAVSALRNEQNIDLEAFGVSFDRFYLESSLYTEGRVENTVKNLIASGKTYEEGGALWLKTTDFGDDKDRVMRKADGGYTYFVPDVAYHVTKWERDFHRAINVQGSDHHGTIARVRAGLQALNIGIPQGFPEYVLHKMVTVTRGGEEVKISKRAGSYVTVRDLIDEVGRDAVRFFLSMRKADSEFVFDIDLARSQAEENPVYYVQYAHARAMSVLRQVNATEETLTASVKNARLDLLTTPREEALLKRLTDFPEMLSLAAKELSPHYVTTYLRDLAGDFHGLYNAERFIVDDENLRHARLCLVAATAQTLRNALALLGITAPQSM